MLNVKITGDESVSWFAVDWRASAERLPKDCRVAMQRFYQG
jgi:hypothetical protein